MNVGEYTDSWLTTGLCLAYSAIARAFKQPF